MDEPGVLNDAIGIAAGGAGVGGGAIVALASVRWFVMWLTGRADKREARIDAQDSELDQKWKAYREALEKRVGALEARAETLEEKARAQQEEIEKCHAERRDLLEMMSRREGFATGRGEARHLGQIEQSTKRVIEGGEDPA